MEENKNELMLWIGILLVIGIFIYFMPDIERAVFGRAKKDKEAGTVEKQKEEESKKEESKKESEKKEEKVTIPSKYECTNSVTESFYKQDEKQVYTYDKNGNTLTANIETTVVVNSAESYNQMKETYTGIIGLFDKLDQKIKDYYVAELKFEDNTRTINVVANVKDYSNAMKIIDEYNKAHENETVSLAVYATYDETEINMKSNGYTCKKY